MDKGEDAKDDDSKDEKTSFGQKAFTKAFEGTQKGVPMTDDDDEEDAAKTSGKAVGKAGKDDPREGAAKTSGKTVLSL